MLEWGSGRLSGEGSHRVLKIILATFMILAMTHSIPLTDQTGRVKADNFETSDDWSLFRHDMNRTGNTTSRAPNTNNVLWTHQTPVARYTWGYASSPAVSNGVVFQGGQYPNLVRAINAETGIQKWQTPTARVTSSPTVANGRVVFGSYDMRIYSIREDNGAVIWNRPVADWVDSSPVVYNGKVYVGSGIGDYVAIKASLLYCLDEVNGNIVWTFQAGGQIISSPTVVDDKVIFGSYDENVYALPTEDPNSDGIIDIAEVIWTFHVGSRIVSSAAVEDDIVYIGGMNGILYALPLHDPNNDRMISPDEVLWTFTSGNEIWSSPGLANGRVFFGSHDSYVYALPMKDPNMDGVITSNEVIWKFKTTDRIWNSPSIAGGKVFIGSEDYTLYALSEETGTLIWKYIMPLQTNPYGSEYLYATPAIVDGRVYIGNYDLTLYCFGEQDRTPPKVTEVNPADDSVDVPLNTNIEITFDEDITELLLSDSSIVLQSSSGRRLVGKVAYDINTKTVTFNPNKDLLPDKRYTVRLRPRYFQDSAGNTLDGNGNGVSEGEPDDPYIWHFNTSRTVGHPPELESESVNPQLGHVTTDFDFFVVYTDEDNDPPLGPSGSIKLFIDDSTTGFDMVWANDTNTPNSHLLDRDYTNGELFFYRTKVNAIGLHSFHVECSDGFNTNSTQTPIQFVVLNTPPELAIPIQYIYEDVEHRFDLTPFAQDVDNDIATLSYGEDSDYCTIRDTHFLSCIFSEEGMLSAIVTVTASDGVDSFSQDVLFIISPMNDAPSLKAGITQLPLVTVYEEKMYIFDLGDYVTDVDTPRELLWVVDDSNYVTSAGLNLYLLYRHGVSHETISLTVRDSSESLQLYLEVTVLPGNKTITPPQVEADLPLTVLAVILIVIIILLMVYNVWIANHRQTRDETPSEIHNQVKKSEKSSERPTTPPKKDTKTQEEGGEK